MIRMKLELKIVDLLTKDVKKGLTINEIAKKSGEYYSFVHRIVNRLAKDGVITKNKVGKSYLCSLNLNNEKTLTLIQLSEIEKKEEFYSANKELKLILEDFVRSLEPQNKNILSIVLFGSYAKGSATKESDIDILIITTGKVDVEKVAKECYAKYGKEVSSMLINTNDFKKQCEKAVIKEIISNHYVLHGVESFVNLVFKK
jgi:predicted nucleotidyltransferase